MKIKWKTLLICIAVPLGVGLISSLLTRDSMEAFMSLEKPSLSPPAILFPIVWTILYVLMGVASYLVVVSGMPYRSRTALTVYGIQLFFNFMWSIIFFNLEMYLLAFVWLCALLILIILNTFLFYSIKKSAGILLIPYILWVTFAGYLNFSIYLLN
ncbi:MAG: tryptophan-rich sensory protein [Clostridia bacterium]|nr:tryptophan-rich sensory protein [Clostridia bacterium]